MKLIKLSIATLMALGTASYASDSIADAFKEGSIKGELKSYYYDKSMNDGKADSSIMTLGLKLDYETADFYNFRVGFGTQTSSAPWSDAESESVFIHDIYGSGTVLSEAYLGYKFNKTDLKLGRQYIRHMMMKYSPSRTVNQSYQGLTAVSKDIEKTIINAAYINKYQNRTDDAGDIGSFEDLGDSDYAYALSVQNNSLENTTLKLGYGDLDNSHSLTYLEAMYKGKTDSFSYLAGAQYHMTKYDDSASKDANYYGLKLGLGMGDFSTYIAYSDQNEKTQYKLVGDGTKPTIFTTAKIDAGQYGEGTQVAFDMNYNFKDLGLKLGARYVDIDFSNESGYEDGDVQTIYSKYNFNKSTNVMVWYEEKDHKSSNPDFDYLWVKVSYKF